MLRKCYQCGGETLGPVVKHSVSDSSKTVKNFVSLASNCNSLSILQPVSWQLLALTPVIDLSSPLL